MHFCTDRSRLAFLGAALSIGLLFACTADPNHEIVRVEAGACDTVLLDDAKGVSGEWTVEGGQFLLIDRERDGRLRFQAPSVARKTALSFRFPEKEIVVTVIPQPTDESYAPGMAHDCAPFRHGVASGDPAADSVLLWSRMTPDAASGIQNVTWQVSDTLDFTVPLQSGTVTASTEADYTLTIEVTGLSPDSTYYYRFLDAQGRSSVAGRTRTAPAGDVEQVRLALVSCSSLYSGYFNAYRRLAERDDIELIVHVGDYIYDFVDEDEQFRLPVPFPTEPDDLHAFRARHAFYLGDPDLRAARAAHPWVVIWDNHDLQPDDRPTFGGGVQAFREWVPMRRTDFSRLEVAYRSFHYGNLADITLGDMMLHRDIDTVTGTTAPSLLGNEQFNWLANELETSTATWRFVGFQKLLMPLLSNFGMGGSTWSGYPESRTELLTFLAENRIEDVVVMSGDAHFTMVGDVTEDPEGLDGEYDPATGEGAVAVEFLGGSITRGNFDETFRGTPEALAAIEGEFQAANPHFIFTDLTRHGYALFDIRPERVVAEWWVTPILEPSDTEAFVAGMTVRKGAMHWDRELVMEPTEALP